MRFKLRSCHQLMYSGVPNKRLGLEVFSDISERVDLIRACRWEFFFILHIVYILYLHKNTVGGKFS